MTVNQATIDLLPAINAPIGLSCLPPILSAELDFCCHLGLTAMGYVQARARYVQLSRSGTALLYQKLHIELVAAKNFCSVTSILAKICASGAKFGDESGKIPIDSRFDFNARSRRISKSQISTLKSISNLNSKINLKSQTQ